MATQTRTRTATFASKSDHMRALFAEGKTIAEVDDLVPHAGYAFVYGVAKRTPDPEHPGQTYADTRASRRAEKAVMVTDDEVKVRTEAGLVIVNRKTGKVTKAR